MAGAQLTNVDALEDLKASVVGFVEDAKVALGAVEMEARRMLDWLEREMPTYWNRRLLKVRDELAQAKAGLARKKLQGANSDHKPDTIEEEKAVRNAKYGMEEAERKLELVKKWHRRFEQAYNEYLGKAGQLSEVVTGNPAKPIVEVNRMIRALDAYLAVSAPQASPAGEASSMAQPISQPSRAVEAPTPPEEPAPELKEEPPATSPPENPASV